MKPVQRFLITFNLLLLCCGTAVAHDPVFSPGPHVLFKQGLEIHVGAHTAKAEQERESKLGLELSYGLTGDWSAGVALPYAKTESGTAESDGRTDMRLFSKYRFWRKDGLGVQESAAVLLNVMLDNGDETTSPPLGSGSTDTLLGFTYGYESLKWYRWSSVRYRRNSANSAGLHRGDQWRLDFALGYRPVMPVYLKPDTVWILELNGERGQRAGLNGSTLADTGGTQWFIAPGIFWTQRNFAIKAGVQLPLVSRLNGRQPESDYRASLEFEWHL